MHALLAHLVTEVEVRVEQETHLLFGVCAPRVPSALILVIYSCRSFGGRARTRVASLERDLGEGAEASAGTARR